MKIHNKGTIIVSYLLQLKLIDLIQNNYFDYGQQTKSDR